MKKTITSLSIAGLLTLSSTVVLADDNYRHYDRGGQDRAKVTWVEPVYNEVRVTTPVEECYETRDYRRGPQQSYTGTIAGGIIGGVIGNQFGGGSGQTAMTVAGLWPDRFSVYPVANRLPGSRLVNVSGRCPVDREQILDTTNVAIAHGYPAPHA